MALQLDAGTGNTAMTPDARESLVPLLPVILPHTLVIAFLCKLYSTSLPPAYLHGHRLLESLYHVSQQWCYGKPIIFYLALVGWWGLFARLLRWPGGFQVCSWAFCRRFFTYRDHCLFVCGFVFFGGILFYFTGFPLAIMLAWFFLCWPGLTLQFGTFGKRPIDKTALAHTAMLLATAVVMASTLVMVTTGLQGVLLHDTNPFSWLPFSWLPDAFYTVRPEYWWYQLVITWLLVSGAAVFSILLAGGRATIIATADRCAAMLTEDAPHPAWFSDVLAGLKQLLLDIYHLIRPAADTTTLPTGITSGSRTTAVLLHGGVFLGILLCGIAAIRLNDFWIYNKIGNVDQWGYTGHFLDFVRMRRCFPTHPAGDLLSTILPAAFFYHFFGALVGNLLFKLSCFTLAGYLFFRLVLNEFQLPTALITTVLLLFCYFFMMAIGADYTDGRVMLYYLATLCAISLSQSATSEAQENRRLLVAGFCFALCLSTAALSLIYGPILLLLYLSKRWRRRKALISVQLIFPIIGCLAGVLALCAIHWSYTGHLLYFANTLDKIWFFLHTNRRHQAMDNPISTAFMQFAHYIVIIGLYQLISACFVWKFSWRYHGDGVRAALKLPLAEAFPALMSSVKFTVISFNPSWQEALRQIDCLFPLLLLANIEILKYFEIHRQQETISNIFYFDQILPLFFLALASTIAPNLRTLPAKPSVKSGLRRTVVAGLATVLLISVQLLIFKHTTAATPMIQFALVRYIPVVLLLAMLITPQPVKVLLILYIYFYSNIYFTSFFTPPEPEMRVRTLTRHTTLLASEAWMRFVNVIDGERKTYLWYGRSERYAPLFISFSAVSHIWQGHVYNEDFPLLDKPMGEMGIIPLETLVKEHIPLLIMTESRTAYAAAVSAFHRRHHSLVLRRQCRFYSGRIQFDVYECQVR